MSRIDELVRLANPKDVHPKVLEMIDAYLDESGIHAGREGLHGRWVFWRSGPNEEIR